MKHHIQYLKYVLLHKWYVFRAGLVFGAPVWRLLVHDLSKFRPGEWIPYARYFYKPGYKHTTAGNRAQDRAWLLHQHRNDHHWQHHVLRSDSGVTGCLPMSWAQVREMVSDWTGAGRAITGDWADVYSWYERNRDCMLMHPLTRWRVGQVMNEGRGRKLFRVSSPETT
jgi:hypothetical protein